MIAMPPKPHKRRKRSKHIVSDDGAAWVINADGTGARVVPRDGKQFELEELQSVVQGFIEIVRLIDGRMMIVNEEGKLRGLPPNRNASMLYNGKEDSILGNVIVTPPEYMH